MTSTAKRSLLCLFAIVATSFCCCLALVSCEKGLGSSAAPGADDSPRAEIAVSNSWLECCLRDLGASAKPLVRVCPPGTCPGHFDIRPGVVADLRQCRLMFLFDFQQSMSEKLGSIAPDGFRTVAIGAPEGLCVPASYLASCQEVHDVLSEAFPERAAELDGAMGQVRDRIGALEREIQEQVEKAGLVDTKVVASGHQAKFCRWLGLDPVATYSGPETASPAQIDDLLDKGRSSGVRFVVINLQESAQAGKAIAGQLDVPVVVFSNFPSMADGETTFDELVRSNVANLIEAAKGNE